MARKKAPSDPLPIALQDLGKVDQLWDVEEGVDLELDSGLSTLQEAAQELQSWLGTAPAVVVPIRWFGQDRSGGRYGLWILHAEAALEAQPVVFFGSEGEHGVIARDLADFLVLLSRGISVLDVIEKTKKFDVRPMPAIRVVAQRHAPQAMARATEVIVAEARALNKSFLQILRGPQKRKRSSG